MGELPSAALAVAVGYAVGAVSPATLIARSRGTDLRSAGSGNPGATNAGRVLGRKWGLVVAVLDVAKGAVPAAAFGLGWHDAGLLAGLAAVVGHITSPFLRGRGGKGVATAGGAVLGSHPLWAPVVVATWLVVLGVSRWVALASVVAALCVPACALALGAGTADVAWSSVLAVLVVVRHRSNFQRWWAARTRRAPGEQPVHRSDC